MAVKKQDKPVKIEIEKSLTIFEAASVHNKIMESYKNSKDIEIDLNSVTSCDTAGIQILYSLKKSGNRDGKKIIFSDPSGALEKALKEMDIPLNIFS